MSLSRLPRAQIRKIHHHFLSLLLLHTYMLWWCLRGRIFIWPSSELLPSLSLSLSLCLLHLNGPAWPFHPSCIQSLRWNRLSMRIENIATSSDVLLLSFSASVTQSHLLLSTLAHILLSAKISTHIFSIELAFLSALTISNQRKLIAYRSIFFSLSLSLFLQGVSSHSFSLSLCHLFLSLLPISRVSRRSHSKQ